jgi:hypothetical protein
MSNTPEERILKLAGRLESQFPGERAAAFGMVDAELVRQGRDWRWFFGWYFGARNGLTPEALEVFTHGGGLWPEAQVMEIARASDRQGYERGVAEGRRQAEMQSRLNASIMGGGGASIQAIRVTWEEMVRFLSTRINTITNPKHREFIEECAF